MEDFIKYLKRKGKEQFTEAKEEEIQQLVEWGKGKLPEEFLWVYQKMMPKNVVGIKDIVIYSMERIENENFHYVPGANIYPLGLFTFASALDGDVICIDLNDKNGSIYQCSHSLLADEEKISFYKNKMVNLEFSYENVIRCSKKLADNYLEFTKELKKSRSITYDVVGIAIDRYGE
ncbi:MAG: SMI1/KNR4 family protein [Lachnospiraceae bacterium]|nr:SMI1/KNR4 family protein [Lachnospiraceae bacterium]